MSSLSDHEGVHAGDKFDVRMSIQSDHQGVHALMIWIDAGDENLSDRFHRKYEIKLQSVAICNVGIRSDGITSGVISAHPV